MEVYKIRHKESGLFYTPTKGKYKPNRTNLCEKGKIYYTKQYPKLNGLTISVSDKQSDKFDTKLNVSDDGWGKYLNYDKNDWEVVIFNLIEVKTI